MRTPLARHARFITGMRGTIKLCLPSAQIPGGYFVRQQDGELKYMVVFSNPQVGQ